MNHLELCRPYFLPICQYRTGKNPETDLIAHDMHVIVVFSKDAHDNGYVVLRGACVDSGLLFEQNRAIKDCRGKYFWKHPVTSVPFYLFCSNPSTIIHHVVNYDEMAEKLSETYGDKLKAWFRK